MNTFIRSLFFLFIALLIADEPCGVAMQSTGEIEKAIPGICLICNELSEESANRSSVQRIFKWAISSTQPVRGVSNIFSGLKSVDLCTARLNFRPSIILSTTKFRNTSTILRI
jgi:hypothetical protein